MKQLLGLTGDELHAFVIGFFEVLCPWEARYIPFNQSLPPLKGEEHYYLAGRGAGFIALLCVITIFIWIIKEVLL